MGLTLASFRRMVGVKGIDYAWAYEQCVYHAEAWRGYPEFHLWQMLAAELSERARKQRLQDEIIRDAEYVMKCPASPVAKRAAQNILDGHGNEMSRQLVRKTAREFGQLHDEYYGS